MLRHSDIWRALDRLATEQGLTPSGLARRAGLDPTTFNRSKRVTRDGKLRWPSTESVSKVLDVTNCSLGHLVTLVDEPAPGDTVCELPVIDLALAELDGSFDEAGQPSGGSWNRAALPDFGDPKAYALRVGGDQLAPIYRDGDVLIASPGTDAKSRDRIVVRMRSGQILVRQITKRSSAGVELTPIGSGRAATIVAAPDIAWIARIIWASQ